LSEKQGKGKVYLVGAGPGDPGLLTLKARDCLGKADVVVYDHLANRVFLDYANERAELIYAGKKGGDHSLSQKEINKLILERARAGATVVRLKGGDPFVFGRGGEEAQELATEGIAFEVVPGVTSAVAVPAYAGIPLTHRDYTSTVAFITGHEDPTKNESTIAWDKLATGAGTLVFLMGVGNLAGIVNNLISHGRAPETPVAVIQRGTVTGQRTIAGDLNNICEKVKTAGLRPPAIIVVGDVVGLREELNWFEKRPLFGKRIIVTRARAQASDLVALLNDLGAQCIEFPTIEIVPPASWAQLDRSISELDKYSWVIFTSVNGVGSFFRRLLEHKKDMRDLGGIKIGAIGPRTAEAIRERGILPDLVPEEFRAEAIVDALKDEAVEGKEILIPRAAEARDVLSIELKKMGARVEVVEAYRTSRPRHPTEEIVELLRRGQIDVVTFTSSSTVTNFLSMFNSTVQEVRGWMRNVVIACIGPITAETAKKHGLSVGMVSREYTIKGLVESIIQHYEDRS